MAKYYGVDVGGTSIRIAEVNPETGEIIGGLESIVKEKVKIFRTSNGILHFIAKHIPHNSNIGISAAGVVEESDLVIRDSPNMPINGVLTFPRDLKNFGAGYDVVATNDMRAASQATARYGEGKDKQNVCTATYSSGFNGAVVRNLENASVAEIGHQLYDRAGTLFCGCGERGHLEPYVSGNGAASMAKQYFSIRTKENSDKIVACPRNYHNTAS